MSDARDACWQPCPRGDSDCCFGLNCFDTSQSSQGTCSSSDYSGTQHFYCGASWCGAAYSCQNACPGGTNEECPAGQYCYADVPCSTTSAAPPDVQPPPSTFNQYCGDTAEDAADQCWQPCRGKILLRISCVHRMAGSHPPSCRQRRLLLRPNLLFDRWYDVFVPRHRGTRPLLLRVFIL